MSAKGQGKRFAGSGALVSTGRRAGVAVTLTGVEDVDRRLKLLEPRLQKKVITQSMRAAMKIVQAQAKSNAKSAFTQRSRDTVRALRVRAVKRSRKRFGVDVRIGKGAYVDKTFYASFLEWGTSRMKAKPFMLPAYVSAGPAAKVVALRLMRAGLEHQVRLLGTK